MVNNVLIVARAEEFYNNALLCTISENTILPPTDEIIDKKLIYII